MCELFAVNSATPVHVNRYLTEFFGHSHANPHGWGVSLRTPAEGMVGDDGVTLWREPLPAYESALAARLLSRPMEARHLQAHIRKATCGTLDVANCHPFLATDVTGRSWTLIHNGILFNEGLLWGYEQREVGQTDSERILLFLIDVIDEAAMRQGGRLDFIDTFDVLVGAIVQLGNHNKLNLILDDGAYTYVHTNTSEVTLYAREVTAEKAGIGNTGRVGSDTRDTASTSGIVFSTFPLGGEDERNAWRPVPRHRLIAYKNGRLRRASTPHGNVFCEAILDAHRALGVVWDPTAATAAPVTATTAA